MNDQRDGRCELQAAGSAAQPGRAAETIVTLSRNAPLLQSVKVAAAAPVPGRNSEATAIQALDPLRGDEALGRLPALNARADTAALVALASELMPAVAAISAYSIAECIAAMRDLGLVVGSIRRHGGDPVTALPALAPVMAGLGRRTGMIGRDTVYHYTEWNPPGSRRRSYTGASQEHVLQDSVRLCLPDLRAAVELCQSLKTLEPADREFGAAAAELARRVRGCVDAIDRVREGVSPLYFARVLRPYFAEIRIGGEVLLGPAAAHIPLGLIDLALWASDRDGGPYAGFRAESARYSPPQWRRLYAEWATGPSLVTRVLEAHRVCRGAGPRLRLVPGTEGLRDTLRALVVFRGRHLVLARLAYGDNVRLYALGSGGGSLDLLSEIVFLTRQNAACMRQVAGHA